MTDEEIQAARALAEAATPEPWGSLAVQGDAQRRTHPSGRMNVNSTASWSVGPDARTMLQAKRDAEFIAAARTLVPRLLDALDEARAERDEWKAAVEYLRTEGRARREAAVVEARKVALLEAADEVRRIRNGESNEPGPYAGYIETWLRARAQGPTPNVGHDGDAT